MAKALEDRKASRSRHSHRFSAGEEERWGAGGAALPGGRKPYACVCYPLKKERKLLTKLEMVNLNRSGPAFSGSI